MCFIFRIVNVCVYLKSQTENVSDVSYVKSSAKVFFGGAIGDNGLSNLHFVPTGKIVDSNYYIEQIFQKERKARLDRTRIFGKLILRNWYSTMQKRGYLTYRDCHINMVQRNPEKLYREMTPTMWYMRPPKAQTSLRIHAV